MSARVQSVVRILCVTTNLVVTVVLVGLASSQTLTTWPVKVSSSTSACYDVFSQINFWDIKRDGLGIITQLCLRDKFLFPVRPTVAMKV